MFSWKKTGSDKAAIFMVLLKVFCQDMSVDRAIDDTLTFGGYCNNPHLISNDQRQRFRQLVEEKLNNSIKRRQEYENASIA